MKLDDKTINCNWRDFTLLEFEQFYEYTTFTDICKDGTTSLYYNKIMTHFVYNFKHDWRYKAGFIAGGHDTEIPFKSIYSRVVSLQGLRMALFIAELNNLELWATIVNIYLKIDIEDVFK